MGAGLGSHSPAAGPRRAGQHSAGSRGGPQSSRNTGARCRAPCGSHSVCDHHGFSHGSWHNQHPARSSAGTQVLHGARGRSHRPPDYPRGPALGGSREGRPGGRAGRMRLVPGRPRCPGGGLSVPCPRAGPAASTPPSALLTQDKLWGPGSSVWSGVCCQAGRGTWLCVHPASCAPSLPGGLPEPRGHTYRLPGPCQGVKTVTCPRSPVVKEQVLGDVTSPTPISIYVSSSTRM